MSPCCLILFINSIVFILVTRVIAKPPKNKSGRLANKHQQVTITVAQVRGAAAVMVLLGITWVFGVFAFGRAKVIFQYVFCVTNSLQGFFIFLVRCLLFPEARAAWTLLLTTGQFKRWKGPRTSVTDSFNSRSGEAAASSSMPAKKNSVTFANPPAKAAAGGSSWGFMKGSKSNRTKERNGPSYMPIVIKANPLYEMQKVNGHPPDHNPKRSNFMNNHSDPQTDSPRPRKDKVTYI